MSTPNKYTRDNVNQRQERMRRLHQAHRLATKRGDKAEAARSLEQMEAICREVNSKEEAE